MQLLHTLQDKSRIFDHSQIGQKGDIFPASAVGKSKFFEVYAVRYSSDGCLAFDVWDPAEQGILDETVANGDKGIDICPVHKLGPLLIGFVAVQPDNIFANFGLS